MTYSAHLHETPLHQWHTDHHGKIVPFAGYSMPLHYAHGILEEHHHVRQKAGLFDVSHMGQFTLQGPHVVSILEKLSPSSFQDMPLFSCQYTVFTNTDGGIVDDLIVTKTGANIFHLVVNAANVKKVYQHLWENLDDYTVMQDLSEEGLIALQGPLSLEILQPLCNKDLNDIPFMHAARLNIDNTPVLLTRTGYTGEKGVEISCPAESTLLLWETLLKQPGTQPIGLGARDSLRLEAGFPLYGQDLDDTTSPVEANLSWLIRQGENASYNGAQRIEKEIKNQPAMRRVGLAIESKIIARPDTAITNDQGETIGRVTSGGFSPTLQKPIAQGYVHENYTKKGTSVFLQVREKAVPACVSSLAFIDLKQR